MCCAQYIPFMWEKRFREYFDKNDMVQKVENLKNGMDNISCEYIDKFMLLSQFWQNSYNEEAYTDYDLKLKEICNKTPFCQPFPQFANFPPFIFSNKYGLIDLPEDVFNNINTKDIIDAGGYNGDTPILFFTIFPESKIFVYEPLKHLFNIINNIKNFGNLRNIYPINKGLGDKEATNQKISFHVTENDCCITTLDQDYRGHNLGLIKLDTEGFESQIIDGAKNLIRNYKPVIASAIYHTPEDFFDLKDQLKEINPDYKFMIRRSEQVIPTADLVLIAY